MKRRLAMVGIKLITMGTPIGWLLVLAALFQFFQPSEGAT